MRHALGWVAVGLLLGIAASGCGPDVSRSDLGTVVYEVPTVAGADEPYQLPELAPPPPGSQSGRPRMPMPMPPGRPQAGDQKTPPSDLLK
jgi:hypothetical protein